MQVLPNFVDMRKDPSELDAESKPFDLQTPAMPVYPYGLMICLENEQLAKLNLDTDCDVGDLIHLEGIGRVTSASKNETTQGVKQRVEIQLTHIALSEDHTDEADVAPRRKIGPASFYE